MRSFIVKDARKTIQGRQAAFCVNSTGAGRQPREFGVHRYAIYTVLLLLFLLMIALGSLHSESMAIRNWFLENGVLEDLQLANISVVCALFAYLSWQSRRQGMADTAMYTMIAAGFLWAIHREMDGVWEERYLNAQYQAARLVITIPLVIYGVLNFKEWWRSCQAHYRTKSFTFLYLGSFGYLLAQTIPSAAMSLGASRLAKRVAEESIETVATVIFVFAAIESYLAWRSNVQTSAPFADTRNKKLVAVERNSAR